MLDDRKSAILQAVVQQYIETAQPVGSSHVVARAGVGVSSATVRNEMTLLEREGYLTQPHTSAGRIPTEKGYRFFVDALEGPGELGPAQTRQVRSFFAHAHGELEQMLRDTSQMLSKLTATTALVVGEAGESATVRSIQVVPLAARIVLIVMVTSQGAVLKRTIECDVDLADDTVARVQDVLAQQFVGRAAHELGEPGPSGDQTVDRVASQVARGARAAIDEDRRVFVEGTSRIADAFDATQQLREILGLLEQQITVVAMLDDVINRGLSVAIGSETGVAPLMECSVVVAPFMIGGEHAGTIGVLGPTRMNYPETLAAVAAVSQRLGRMLTEGG
jgi:heat-inducible transcriptional repressor